MLDEFRSGVVDAVERAASALDIEYTFSLEHASDMTFISISEGEDRGWDRLYRVTISGLPGGSAHMAHVMVATAPVTSRGEMRLEQLEHLMAEHRRRTDRVRAIGSSGCDPLSPPYWSLKAKRATIGILRAMARDPDDLGNMEPFYTGELTAHVPVPEGHVNAVIRDDVLTWSSDPGASASVPRWTYDDGKGQIRVYGMRLPETTCQALTGSRLSEVVDDDVLSKVDLRIDSARNEGQTIILVLEEGWEWLAAVPDGIDGSWREPTEQKKG